MIREIAKRAARNFPPAPDDYIVDGLRHCAKCKKPKEKRVLINDREEVVTIPCECQQAEDREKTEQAEQWRHFRECLALPVYALQEAGYALHAAGKRAFALHDGSNPRALKIAKRYVDVFPAKGCGLMLWGNCGTGKSYLAACIVNALLEEQIPALMVSTVRLLNYITGKDVNANNAIDSLRRFDLLVLDDFGAERQTPYIIENLTEIVNAREGKPLIITCNISPEQLKEPPRELERLYDRVGSCIPVPLLGESKRKQKGQELKAEMREILFAD